jgi:C4-dicarboxylate-specific signal transduction histidine kinase
MWVQLRHTSVCFTNNLPPLTAQWPVHHQAELAMRAETPLTASCRLPPHRLQPARATKRARAGRQDQLRSLESNDDDAIPAVLSRSNNAPMRVTWRRDQGEDISHACATATQLAERVRRERHLLTHCRRRSLAPRAAELPRLQIGSSTDLRSWKTKPLDNRDYR